MTVKRGRELVVWNWKPAFLHALEETGHVGKSCEAVNISRNTVYTHRRVDAEFAKAWDEALNNAAWTLEDEAWRRARDGVNEPIVANGKIIGTQKKYSDTLLIFLLKGIKPDKYADKLVVKIDPEQAALLRKHGLSPSEAWLQLMQSLADEEVDATAR